MSRFVSYFVGRVGRALALACCCLVPTLLLAADPLYLEPPYDEVTLDANNGNAQLKVLPLALPGRMVPPPEQRTGDLQIELLDRLGQKFNVAWTAVVSVKLFEEFVLAEANEHVQAGRFDEAFPYFQFLERKYPTTPGLKESLENFLYAQILQEFKAKRFDHALALLVNLHERNPQKPGLNTAYERVTSELVKARLAEKNFVAARGLLGNLAARFPATRATTIAAFEAQLVEQAKALQSEAQAHMAAGKLGEAHRSAQQMLAIWPTLPGGAELAQSIHDKHPVVTIGRTSEWVQPADVQAAGTASVEMVEVAMADSALAVRALKRGEIDVLDRVPPWELKRVAGSADIAVVPYAQPSVHLLVPNPNKPLAASRVLRRALAYGIDREGILRRSLLGGQAIEGCEVLSGPLPRGAAYDAAIEPKPYDPALAAVLVGAEPAAASSGGLVLAHPAGPIPRLACQSIAGQLAAIGLPVTLRELAIGELPGAGYDLLYVESTLSDPANDAWSVLGPEGAAGQCSPAMLLALRAVETAGDDAAKTAALHAAHRLAASELAVIPLWQLTEHLAHQTSVSGIGERPRALYEHRPEWQAKLRLPTE